MKAKLNALLYQIQAALVICGLFICEFAYMRLKNGFFSGTYPLIYSDHRSFYMRIHYMRAYFWSPYLWHITRSTCTTECVTDLDSCSQMIIFQSIMTFFELSIIFIGSWGCCVNWLEPKIYLPSANLACSKPRNTL